MVPRFSIHTFARFVQEVAKASPLNHARKQLKRAWRTLACSSPPSHQPPQHKQSVHADAVAPAAAAVEAPVAGQEAAQGVQRNGVQQTLQPAQQGQEQERQGAEPTAAAVGQLPLMQEQDEQQAQQYPTSGSREEGGQQQEVDKQQEVQGSRGPSRKQQGQTSDQEPADASCVAAVAQPRATSGQEQAKAGPWQGHAGAHNKKALTELYPPGVLLWIIPDADHPFR